MMFLASWPKRWTRLIARESLFEVAGGFLGFFFPRVGAFPVKRDTADMSTVKRAARFLKNGELVGIFPEGTRRGKGNQDPCHPWWCCAHREARQSPARTARTQECRSHQAERGARALPEAHRDLW